MGYFLIDKDICRFKIIDRASRSYLGCIVSVFLVEDDRFYRSEYGVTNQDLYTTTCYCLKVFYMTYLLLFQQI